MIKKYLACCLITLLGIANVEANFEANVEGAPCAYQDKDLTDSLLKLDNVVSVASEVHIPHPNSEIPLKHVVVFQGGDVAIIEQKNCDIFNLSISMLASEDTAEEIIVKRLSDILKITPVVSKHFKNTNFNNDLNKNIKDGHFSLSQKSLFKLNLTDIIDSDTALTDMIFIYSPDDSIYALYSRSISFYIGAGMHN
jgi:hypothetical protein